MDKVRQLCAKHNIHIRVPHYRDTMRHASHAVHCTYFGSVFMEGHGLYATAGGMLLILGVLNYFLHFEGA